MSFLQLEHIIRRLSPGQLRKLDEWLHEVIRRDEGN